MQQMESHEGRPEGQDLYGAYHGSGLEGGQKVAEDGDERFAEMLARKIKDELRSEVRAASTLGYRLALAIVSVCIVVPLFGILVWALSLNLGGGAAIGLTWGFLAACVVIIVVNAYFNKVVSSASDWSTKTTGAEERKG